MRKAELTVDLKTADSYLKLSHPDECTKDDVIVLYYSLYKFSQWFKRTLINDQGFEPMAFERLESYAADQIAKSETEKVLH